MPSKRREPIVSNAVSYPRGKENSKFGFINARNLRTNISPPSGAPHKEASIRIVVVVVLLLWLPYVSVCMSVCVCVYWSLDATKCVSSICRWMEGIHEYP